MRRLALVAAALVAGIATSAVGMPHSPAAAGHNPTELPADCTVVIHDGARNATLTCTDRPAGQQWRMSASCIAFGFEDAIKGNVVTGSGSSTGTRSCHAGRVFDNTVFFNEV